VSTLDERAAAVAARVKTMRKAEQDARVEPGAVSDYGRHIWQQDHGIDGQVRALQTIAFIMHDTDPVGFAAALHMLGRQIDIPTVMNDCWFFTDTAKPTWERVEALLAPATSGDRT
jgi:hypothetical protein